MDDQGTARKRRFGIRFSIRDLLWLTLVVALAFALWFNQPPAYVVQQGEGAILVVTATGATYKLTPGQRVLTEPYLRTLIQSTP